MAKSFIDVVHDSPITGLGIPVKTVSIGNNRVVKNIFPGKLVMIYKISNHFWKIGKMR